MPFLRAGREPHYLRTSRIRAPAIHSFIEAADHDRVQAVLEGGQKEFTVLFKDGRYLKFEAAPHSADNSQLTLNLREGGHSIVLMTGDTMDVAPVFEALRGSFIQRRRCCRPAWALAGITLVAFAGWLIFCPVGKDALFAGLAQPVAQPASVAPLTPPAVSSPAPQLAAPATAAIPASPIPMAMNPESQKVVGALQRIHAAVGAGKVPDEADIDLLPPEMASELRQLIAETNFGQGQPPAKPAAPAPAPAAPVEAPKAEAPKAEAPKAEAPAPAPLSSLQAPQPGLAHGNAAAAAPAASAGPSVVFTPRRVDANGIPTTPEDPRTLRGPLQLNLPGGGDLKSPEDLKAFGLRY